MDQILSLILLIMWIAGVVIAKGFMSVTIAIFFPPWAWYLVIEAIMTRYVII